MKRKMQFFTGFVVFLFLLMAACSPADEQATGEESFGEAVNFTITGIDPGAGIMEQTERALSEYGLENWTVQESSGAAMTAELERAIAKEEAIIVTGWIPHWKFFRYDLKILDDPKKVYGDEGKIHTLVRKGLKEDLPGAYTFFSQFHWEPEHMQEVMLKIAEGMPEEEAAAEWVQAHNELVQSWIDGVEPGNGAKLTMPYVAWDDIIASTNVVKYVLEEKLDYEVDIVQVEPGPMFASVAEGSADAMIGAWLPDTHAAYYAEYEGQFEDLGVNLTGTRNGLVVPDYVEIDSIEDLQ